MKILNYEATNLDREQLKALFQRCMISLGTSYLYCKLVVTETETETAKRTSESLMVYDNLISMVSDDKGSNISEKKTEWFFILSENYLKEVKKISGYNGNGLEIKHISNFKQDTAVYYYDKMIEYLKNHTVNIIICD